MKQLYSLISNLTSPTKENPLPDCNSHKELAESFSEFFITKIRKMRDSLESFLKYQPMHRSPMMLSSFTPYSEEEIAKIIKNMTSKHCGLDPVPTWLLKRSCHLLYHPSPTYKCVFRTWDICKAMKSLSYQTTHPEVMDGPCKFFLSYSQQPKLSQ